MTTDSQPLLARILRMLRRASYLLFLACLSLTYVGLPDRVFFLLLPSISKQNFFYGAVLFFLGIQVFMQLALWLCKNLDQGQAFSWYKLPPIRITDLWQGAVFLINLILCIIVLYIWQLVLESYGWGSFFNIVLYTLLGLLSVISLLLLFLSAKGIWRQSSSMPE